MPVLRFLRVVLGSFAKPRLAPLEESVLRLRVWPNDLDVNRHLNNGRAIMLTDLGRWDLIARSGLGRAALRHRWVAAVTAQAVRFRKPALLFQRLTLRSRVLCWDERRIYLEHRLERGDAVVLRSLLQSTVVGPRGVVPTAQVMRELGLRDPSPPMPDEVRRWVDALLAAPDGRGPAAQAVGEGTSASAAERSATRG